MEVERGVLRIVIVVSALGLVVSVIALVVAAVNYGERSTAMEPFDEMMDHMEAEVDMEEASEQDVIKLRQYVAYEFVYHELGISSVQTPTAEEAESRDDITSFVRRYADRNHPVRAPLGVALMGVLWFGSIWLVYGVVRWIIKGFRGD